MRKHASPAKVVRSYKRLINFLLQKPKSNLVIECLPTTEFPPRPVILSRSLVTSHSISARTRRLNVTKPASVNILPNLTKISPPEKEVFVSKLENVQIELIQLENDFRERIALKDEHIQILSDHLRKLPAQNISQFQQSQQPQPTLTNSSPSETS